MRNYFKRVSVFAGGLFLLVWPGVPGMASDSVPQVAVASEGGVTFASVTLLFAGVAVVILVLMSFFLGMEVRRRNAEKWAALSKKNAKKDVPQAIQRPRRKPIEHVEDVPIETSDGHSEGRSGERSDGHADEDVSIQKTVSSPDVDLIQGDASRLPAQVFLVGRQSYKTNLDNGLADPQVAVISLIAAAGVGKTALLKAWAKGLESEAVGRPTLFFWSFHGEDGDERQRCSEPFFNEARTFFGDRGNQPDSAEASAHRLGEQLQKASQGLADGSPTVLILDGVETLQYKNGALADYGLHRLFSYLGQNPAGQPWKNTLVVVSSRQMVFELAARRHGAGRTFFLGNLREKEGTQLLHALGIKGKFLSFRAMVKALYGHALALTLLGRMLSKYYKGNIVNKDRLLALFWVKDSSEEPLVPPVAEALPKETVPEVPMPNGVADLIHKVLAYYDTQLGSQGHRGVFLRLLGLFDRPMDEKLLEVLCQEATLAKPLCALEPGALDAMLTDLRQDGLLLMDETPMVGAQIGRSWGRSWQAHAFVRAYFRETVRRENLDGWRQAHRQLAFHFNRALTGGAEGSDSERLVWFYRSMHHACLAGAYAFALREVYQKRMFQRDVTDTVYADKRVEGRTQQSPNLEALAGFFPDGWHRPPVTADLSLGDRRWLVVEAATSLIALGQITDAVGPRREEVQMAVDGNEYQNAPVTAANLCDLLRLSGALREAQTVAEKGIGWAEQSVDLFWKMVLKTLLATTLHQLGEVAESLAVFQSAEAIEEVRQPSTPRLLGVQGRLYCDLLLESAREPVALEAILARVTEFFHWRAPGDPLQEVAQDHLLHSRVLMACGREKEAREALDQAMVVARDTGLPHIMAEVLGDHASFLRQQGELEAAHQHLEEALLTSVRSGLRPCEAEGRLLEGHLFLDENDLERAETALVRAETLIKEMESGRHHARASILRARLLHQQGKPEESTVWRKQARERIEAKGQWGLLPFWEQEVGSEGVAP